MSRVACHKRQEPQPRTLPQYAQQDAAADPGLDPLLTSRKVKKERKNCALMFNHFLAKIAISETNVHSLSCPKESFCNQLIGLLTFSVKSCSPVLLGP